MKRFKQLLALGLSLTLLAACAPKEAEATPTPEPTPTPVESAAPTPTPADKVQVNVAMLKGTTGLGACKLMDDAGKGETANDYTFTLLGEGSEAVAALSNGTADIAALPTNLASTLYHKLDGGVQLLCLNTLGVLYILESGETISEVADLKGKTIHAFGQGANPEYVLNYLLEKNGLTAGEDVTVEWHAATDEVSALVASGEAEVAMLPVPAATTAVIQSQGKARFALDLSEEWEKAGAEGVLTMGCAVVRTAFAQEHPEAVEAFLAEYGASIAYMSDEANLDAAAALAESCGIIPKAAVAKKALPDANLCFITGDEMIDGIQGYYQVLFAANPASIGGSIPDGAFYYNYQS